MIAQDYFQEMFKSSNPTRMDDIYQELQTKVTDEMNYMLTELVTDQEVKDALFLIGPVRAPEPDGITSAFYQQFWRDIGEDVCTLIRRFFESSEMESDLNKTNICFIPKIKEPKVMSDFRPISMCTVSYKIISKILVMRLKNCLDMIISESQAAFVQGRNITDNVLVAHELMHALKSKKDVSEKYVAVKTDISKAYDRVEWSFLE